MKRYLHTQEERDVGHTAKPDRAPQKLIAAWIRVSALRKCTAAKCLHPVGERVDERALDKGMSGAVGGPGKVGHDSACEGAGDEDTDDADDGQPGGLVRHGESSMVWSYKMEVGVCAWSIVNERLRSAFSLCLGRRKGKPAEEIVISFTKR